MIKIIWRINLKDKTSGFSVYRKEVLDKIWPLTKSKNLEFLFELLILAKKFNFKITENQYILLQENMVKVSLIFGKLQKVI